MSFSRGVEFPLFMIQAPLVPESRVRIYGVIVHRLCRGQIAAQHPAPGTGMIVFITTPDHHTTFKALVAGAEELRDAGTSAYAAGGLPSERSDEMLDS